MSLQVAMRPYCTSVVNLHDGRSTGADVREGIGTILELQRSIFLPDATLATLPMRSLERIRHPMTLLFICWSMILVHNLHSNADFGQCSAITI